MEDALLGFLLGLVASILVWYTLSHLVVPKIQFASILSKVETLKGGKYKYRIGIKNTGRRDIIDATIFFELLIKGFDLEVPSNTDHIPILLNKERLPDIKKGRRWSLEIELNKLPEYFKDRIVGYDNTLEKAMSFDNCHARIIVMGYDVFSGARKVFESKKYTIKDIVEDKLKQEYFKKSETIPLSGFYSINDYELLRYK